MTADIELERDRIARIRTRCREVCDDMDRALDALDPERRGNVDARRRVAAEDAAARELCRLAADWRGGVTPEQDWPDYLPQARVLLRAAAAAATA